eukprot:2625353-Amphidinium_carterae.1
MPRELALSEKEVLTPFFDDEIWLSEELAGLDAEGDALDIQKVQDGDTVALSTACLQEDLCSSLSRIAGDRNCPVLTRKSSSGRAWVLRGAHWPFKRGASPQNRR